MVESVKGKIAGEVKLAQTKVRCAGIGTYLKRVMCRPEETGNLAWKLYNVVHHMREGDERGETMSFVQGLR